MILEDDGFIEINIPVPGQDAPLKFNLDVYVVSELFARAAREAEGDNMVYETKLREAMMQLGIPPVLSFRANTQIVKAVQDRMDEFEKKDAATQPPAAAPGSPTTTS